jgi:hypothetical protein
VACGFFQGVEGLHSVWQGGGPHHYQRFLVVASVSSRHRATGPRLRRDGGVLVFKKGTKIFVPYFSFYFILFYFQNFIKNIFILNVDWYLIACLMSN